MEREIKEFSLEFWFNDGKIKKGQELPSGFSSKSTRFSNTIDRLCNVVSGPYTQINEGGRYPIFLSNNNNYLYMFDIFTIKGHVYFLSIKYHIYRNLEINKKFCEEIYSHFVGKVQAFEDMEK